jgi:N-acetylglucosamine-6-sulfatase
MRRWWPYALLGVTAVAAIVRFATLDAQSFDHDEAVTAARILHPSLFDTLSEVAHGERSPPLYYVLVWGWSRIFGTGELGLQSLSAILGKRVDEDRRAPIFWLWRYRAGRRRPGYATSPSTRSSVSVRWCCSVATKRDRRRVFRTGFAIAIAGIVLSAAGCGSGGPAVRTTTGSKIPPPTGSEPNVIVVMSDDQDAASMPEAMPRTERLARMGTTFTDFVVTTPSCCPSRATFLTGQYGHNNGVLANVPGYPDLTEKENVLSAWLQRAGYRTAEFGKFMNLYENASTENGNLPAPGWDVWEPLLPPYSYFDYSLSIDGRSRHFGTANRDYLTDVLIDRAVRYIEADRSGSRPFFAWVNLYAPHLVSGAEPRAGRCPNSAIPAPGDRDRFTPGNVPTPRSFGEDDVSDKPQFVRARPPLNQARAERYRRDRACRLDSLAAVDRGVARIYSSLRRTGQLDDTLLMFTSDNGWLEGEHRMEGKALPYEEAVRVPLIVWAPPNLRGSASSTRVSDPAANIDLAPTILQAASGQSCRTKSICRVVDGRSLVPLLRGHAETWPKDRPILLESREGDFGICEFDAVRTPRYLYAEYSPFLTGSSGDCAPVNGRELYDLRSDPSELENLLAAPVASPDARVASDLSNKLVGLRECQGSAADWPSSSDIPVCP